MPSLLSLVALVATVPVGQSNIPVSLDVVPFLGLNVKVNGVTLVESSGFQYFDAATKAGHFSSRWSPVEISRLGDGSIQLRYNGANGQAVGTHTYRRTAQGFTARYEFRWRGDRNATLDATMARLWTPFLEGGTGLIDGSQTGPLNTPMRAGTYSQRTVGVGQNFAFRAPGVRVEVTSDRPLRLVDARNETAEWASGKELFTLGTHGQGITPQQTQAYNLEWKITPVHSPNVPVQKVQTAPQALTRAVTPDERALPLVPKPVSRTDGAGFLTFGQKITVTSSDAGHQHYFDRLLNARWDTSSVTEWGSDTTVAVSYDAGIGAEEYRLSVRPDGVSITAGSAKGVRNALSTLVMLTRPRGGAISVPVTQISDKPSVGWRGVHMFVGPTAREFQSELMDRVLAPLKFNNVVLQCERTAWEVLPGTQTPITMSKADLAALSDRYREQGIEVVPLVQSLGHASWFFANGQNLDLALNPDVPFTMDPRKLKTRDVLGKLWREVIETTRPSVIHFGLDEIDNRGVRPDDNFTTRLWERHLPWLNTLSQEVGKSPMIWGDMMVHASESPDAAHADTVAAAKARRQLLRSGTYVADWHYIDDPKPESYKSLAIFKNAGARPIAASWFRHRNIRGHTLAAVKVGAGTLQTTWAGYESSEANMVRELPQFAAYVVAADYAWSGRADMPNALGYDPADLFRRLYFAHNAPVSAQPGVALGIAGDQTATNTTIGRVAFRLFRPLQLSGVTDQAAVQAPTAVDFTASGKGTRLALALDTTARVDEMAQVATVEIVFSDGSSTSAPVYYGADVRSIRDTRSTARSNRVGTVSAFIAEWDDEKAVQTVRVEVASRAAGIRVHGLTVY